MLVVVYGLIWWFVGLLGLAVVVMRGWVARLVLLGCSIVILLLFADY